MRLGLEFVGSGAKWSLLVLQLACLFNSCLVTGVDDTDDMTSSESRSPYVYLAHREYQVNPSSGQYEEIAQYSEQNATASPPGTLKKYTERLKVQQRRRTTTTTTPSSTSQEYSDQSEADSVTSQRFENAYTRYNYADNNGQQRVERSDANPGSIRDILNQRQGAYATTTPGYSSETNNNGQAPSYDNVQYQSPLISYEVPSNYFPSENFDWPSSYVGTPTYGPPIHHPGPGPANLVAPFLSGVGHLTSSVKHIKSEIGEQKAKTAYQVAEVVKGTGHAVNNAILSKGHVAGQVIGQTIQTAGEALKSKGYTAQKIIHNKGQLATSAIQSVGNIGSSLLRSKGELVGAVLKTGAAIGTTALGTASNALAGGTYLVKAKGDAASTLIAKGGKLASGVIGTKGRIISNVINAKGQFVAQIVEAKGRAAATLLETSGQKLTQLAEAIKSATARKPGPGWGGAWGSAPAESYSAPPAGGSGLQTAHKVEAQLVHQEEPLVSNQGYQEPQSYQQQDYADSYYDPRDNYQRSQRSSSSKEREQQLQQDDQAGDSVQDQGRNNVGDEGENLEEFQHEYSSYYQPHHYSSSPSAHQDYPQQYHEYTPEPWE